MLKHNILSVLDPPAPDSEGTPLFSQSSKQLCNTVTLVAPGHLIQSIPKPQEQLLHLREEEKKPWCRNLPTATPLLPAPTTAATIGISSFR